MSKLPNLYHRPQTIFQENLANVTGGFTSHCAKPFLKWVGGKHSILPELLARVPDRYDLYCEPFLGGGTLFFALHPEKAYLSDINPHLAATFRAVRDNVEPLVDYLRIHASKHSPAYYYKAREHLFVEGDRVKIASLFIYLNKTCFNGLYRVNKKGKFNVSIGDYKTPAILDETNLRACSRLLQGKEIRQHDFSQIKLVKNGFYYLDPPYHKAYDGYNRKRFSDCEHKRLAEFCHRINRAGGHFMLSNSDTPFVRKLYKGCSIETVESFRSVSCKGSQRGKTSELIIRNYK